MVRSAFRLPFVARDIRPHVLRPLSHNRGLASISANHNASIVPGGIRIASTSHSKQLRSTLPNLWLRDNCRCSKCVNQDTLQRNFDTFKISKDIAAKKVTAEDKGLKVTWSDGDHQSWYPWSFLNFYQSENFRVAEELQQHLWGAEIGESPPEVSYEDLMDPRSEGGVAKLTNAIRQYGFALVPNTPYHTPDATLAVLEKIAFVRITHYGGFYDFVPDLAMADTAYTNLALAAHTDTTYFSDPVGLQAFHLLSHIQPKTASSASSTGGPLGGRSLLVDGFHAARILKQEDPEAYKILATVRLPWHASGNKGITIAPDRRYPVLEVDASTGELYRVRWNNDDRGVVPFDDGGVSPAEWYEAARKWDAILRRKEVEHWMQLTPGCPLIFDNWRVLHGRSAFEGLRRICGGYINRDDFISRWRNTNFPREEILKQVIG